MMEVRCGCGRLLKVPDGLAGRRVECPACGARLPVPGGSPEGVDVSFEDDYAIKPPSQRTCGACGTPVAEDAVVCTNCGMNFATGLHAHTADPTTPQDEEGGRRVPKVVVLTAAGILALGAATFLLVRGGKANGDGAEPPAPAPKEELVPTDYLLIQAKTLNRARKLQFLLSVQSSLRAYRAINGRYPASLDDLAAEHMPAPALPEGLQYKYDPTTGAVDVVKTGPLESR